MVSAMIARHSSDTSRTCSAPTMPASLQRRGQQVPAGDEGRHAGEGDPEQQHQDRHAADDLDIEARGLAQPDRARQRHQRDAEPDRRGEREGDDGDDDGDADALGDGREDLAVEIAGDDRSGRGDGEHHGGDQPPGELRLSGSGEPAASAQAARPRLAACALEDLLAHAAAPLVDARLSRSSTKPCRS